MLSKNCHKLKIYKEHYNNVRNGTKTFEIRVNDRAFQKGDRCELYYWPRTSKSQTEDIQHYTSKDFPCLRFVIGDVYPIDADRVVFSLLREADHEKN
jgi:ASC-1-like (ASCH) protein